jgi:Zn-dependent peptidase ImmA (M78 family)
MKCGTHLSKFKLAGMDWVTVRSETDALGYTDPDSCRIIINKKLEGQATEVTFYHELVHAIMFTMGERNHDERFIEGFAQLLYQYERQRT